MKFFITFMQSAPCDRAKESPCHTRACACSSRAPEASVLPARPWEMSVLWDSAAFWSLGPGADTPPRNLPGPHSSSMGLLPTSRDRSSSV